MYLREMIEEHKNSIDITERDDLFGAMLTVNMNPEESLDEQLSEQELLGNILLPEKSAFVFMKLP